jgi:hypothetical protein
MLKLDSTNQGIMPFSTKKIFSRILYAIVLTVCIGLSNKAKGQQAVAPTKQATNINVLNGYTHLIISWTRGNGDYCAVFVKENATEGETAPVTDGTEYRGSSKFKEGQPEIGTGWYCVYSGTGNRVTVTGLKSGLQSSPRYAIQVVECNGLSTNQKYLTTTAPGNPISASTRRFYESFPIEFETVFDLTAKVILHKAESGLKRVVFVKAGGTDQATPVDNTSYYPHIFRYYNWGTQIGSTGWYCVHNSSDAELDIFTIAALTGNTNYTMQVVEYEGEKGHEKYKSSSELIHFKTLPTRPRTTYDVVPSSGVFDPIVDGMEIEFIDAIKLSPSIPLGFTFMFDGVPFTHIRASKYGYLTFNSFTNSASYSNSLDYSGVRPLIAPFWGNLLDSPGKASCTVSGKEGERVFTFEWLNYGWQNKTSTEKISPEISFQVKLYETTNKIEFIYRQEGAELPDKVPAAIGLAHHFNGNDHFVSLNNSGTNPEVVTKDFKAQITTRPATGQGYSFTPKKFAQTIEFQKLEAKTFGDAPFTLSANVDSELTVTYASSDPEVATVEGNVITITGAGSATITAYQAGNTQYEAATEVSQTLVVKKKNQFIDFDRLPEKSISNSPFVLSAEATSGLPVTYKSLNTSVATVNGNMVTIVGAGTAEITASQSGNNNFEAAEDVARFLYVVNKAAQTISFDAIEDKTLNDAPFVLTASSTSALPVSFETNSNRILIQGKVVTVVDAGSVTITAVQKGNSKYAAAEEKRTFCINPPQPKVTVDNTNPNSVRLVSVGLYAMQWLKDGKAIPGATDMSLTIIDPGTYTVVNKRDQCESNPSNKYILKSNGEVEIVTGVEVINDADVEVYPNPMINTLTIDVSSAKTNIISVYDVAGKKLQSQSGKGCVRIDVSSLKQANYLIQINNGNHIILRRVSKR